jgi:hypothetical protein
MESSTIQILQSLLQWIVAPVAAFVWLIYRQQQQHSTEIAVLKAEATLQKKAHEDEIAEIRSNMRSIMAKLDSIELALRK